MENYKAPISYKGTNHKFTLSLEQLIHLVSWEKRAAPRKEAFYSKYNDPYTYGKGNGIRTYYPQAIPDFFKPTWELAEFEAGCSFEACFLNYYSDGHDHLGWHADDSVVIDEKKPIAVISFGAEREIWFRPNDNTWVEKILLHNASLLLMNAGMQQTHQHRIPKHSAICGARVSATFRGLKGI